MWPNGGDQDGFLRHKQNPVHIRYGWKSFQEKSAHDKCSTSDEFLFTFAAGNEIIQFRFIIWCAVSVSDRHRMCSYIHEWHGMWCVCPLTFTALSKRKIYIQADIHIICTKMESCRSTTVGERATTKICRKNDKNIISRISNVPVVFFHFARRALAKCMRVHYIQYRYINIYMVAGSRHCSFLGSFMLLWRSFLLWGNGH